MSMWLHVVTHPAYLILCLVVGLMGRKRRTGIAGYFLMSFALTPLLMLFVLYVGGERPLPRDEEEDDDIDAEIAAERAAAQGEDDAKAEAG